VRVNKAAFSFIFCFTVASSTIDNLEQHVNTRVYAFKNHIIFNPILFSRIHAISLSKVVYHGWSINHLLVHVEIT